MSMNTTVTTPQDILTKIENIETICGRDIGNGIELLVKASKGGLLEAARSIAECPSPHVAIITGFFVPHGTPPAAETDGPIGSIHIAAGLQRAGIPVRLVADSLCSSALKATAQSAELSEQVPFDIVSVNDTDTDSFAVSSLLNLWRTLPVPISHVISIECAGPSFDGTIRNMIGEDITVYNAPLHQLFTFDTAVSIGIGDAGNELGMGNLPQELIIKGVNTGETIACATPCNHLIVCGVSNWGAMGLLVALALLRSDLTSELTESLTLEMDKKMLTGLVYEGPAVDGDTGIQALSVDTLPWEYHGKVLTEILTTAGLNVSV